MAKNAPNATNLTLLKPIIVIGAGLNYKNYFLKNPPKRAGNKY